MAELLDGRYWKKITVFINLSNKSIVKTYIPDKKARRRHEELCDVVIQLSEFFITNF
jgi:hypothetical protein